jgi:PhnB protein
MSESELNNIMHISLPVGDAMLMGSDTGGEWAPDFKVGNNVQLSINADSREDADRMFKALSDGGNVTMPMADMFWGDYYGMCTDKFGVNWMMSYNAQSGGGGNG